jgi:membrane protein
VFAFMKSPVMWELLKETFNEWSADKVPRLGAALAYYAVFSIAPMLMIAIGIAGLVFGERAAEGQIVNQLETTVGRPVAQAVQDILKSANQAGHGWAVTIVGIATLVLGASGMFIALQDALNTIWRVPPKPGLGLLQMVRHRFFSFLAVMSVGLLVLASLVVSTGLAAVAKFLTLADLPGSTYLWQVFEIVFSFCFVMLLFAMVYKILPDARIAWAEVWFGAAVTALLFTMGKFLLGLYLAWAGTESAFGAAGSLVVILLWVYYSSQILLFGAEFTRVRAERRRREDTPVAMSDSCRAGNMPR